MVLTKRGRAEQEESVSLPQALYWDPVTLQKGQSVKSDGEWVEGNVSKRSKSQRTDSENYSDSFQLKQSRTIGERGDCIANGNNSDVVFDLDDENAPVTEELYRKHVWDIIDSYFEENRGLQSQAIASFNRFMKETLPSIVEACGRVSVDDWHNDLTKTVHTVEFTKVYIEEKIVQNFPDGTKDFLFPHEARIRNLNYCTPLCVDIKHIIKLVDGAGDETIVKVEQHQKIQIADIPVMIKSEFCNLYGLDEKQLASHYEDPNDPGGYFIINGKEKVIVTQEKPANNKLFLFKPMCDSKYQYESEIRSSVDPSTDKVSAFWIHIPGNPKSYKNFKDAQRVPTAVSGRRDLQNKTVYKSLQSEAMRKNVWQQYKKTRPGLVVTIASVRGTVPLLILYKALGFEADKDIWETFMVDPEDIDFYEAIRSTMENTESKEVLTEEDALYYIGCRSIREQSSIEAVVSHGATIISEEILPSLGPEKESNQIKGYHVGYMVNRLIFAYLGRIQCDDRDHLQNKRFDLAGPMLANLFKAQIRSLMRETKLAILRRLDAGVSYNVEKNIIRHKLITRGLLYALMTGNWGDRRRGSPGRVGVAQLVNRLTGIATLSYLRRINSPVNRLVRMTAPRQVHTTAFGYICPADTPEGETVGLLKSLSVMAEVSIDSEKIPIVNCLEASGYHSMEEYSEKLAADIKILIDSEIMGTCPRESVASILNALKQCRRNYDEDMEREQLKHYEDPDYVGAYNGFPNQVSLTYDSEHREIRIRTDPGRAYRPLLVVKNNKLVLQKRHIKRLLDPKDPYSWKSLVKDGVIEYLDAAESETAMIAMFPSDLKGKNWGTRTARGFSSPMPYTVTYTHCEIHPSMILGVCASLIPYPDHNQSPRNTYQSGMAKQAIGVYQTNFFHRPDTESHVLHYPQRPLVTTKTAKFIKYDDNPAGINAIVAICCYSGYNQEDSVILNKSAVQRGMFRSTLYKTMSDEAKIAVGRGDMDEIFELPRQGEVRTFKSANSNYTHLDEDGFPFPGSQLTDLFALIGKTQMIGENDENRDLSLGRKHYTKTDRSTMFKSSSAHPSNVDSVILTNNPEGYRMVKVKTRTPRIPQIGDKFASRHGQKGVVGMDFDESDLPFTKEGIVPDLILNPHAIPSRMTIGHLLETVEAKVGALKGQVLDATCFTRHITGEEIGMGLEGLGFHKHGMEVMYCGATGRKIMSQIFIGPVFYQVTNQRLKHMTEDKLHIRSRGPVTELCRQPTAGLQKDGGLRFGEMERDCTISHGAASFLRERLFIMSDFHAQPICKTCGSFLTRAPKNADKDFITHIKCRFCRVTSSGAATVEIPYACKLLFQELMSMNIRVTVTPESDLKGRKLVRSKKTKKVVCPFIIKKITFKIVRKPLQIPEGSSIVDYLIDKIREDELKDG